MTKFNDNTDMYVGTLTADEMSFAGATGSTNYTHYLMNSYTKSHDLYWWGLSPGSYYADFGSAFPLGINGSLDHDLVDRSGYSRPAVSLKSSTIIKTGNGTKSNPYTVE